MFNKVERCSSNVTVSLGYGERSDNVLIMRVDNTSGFIYSYQPIT